MMRPPSRGTPTHTTSEQLPAGTPSAGGLPDATLEVCQLRWLNDALAPLGRLEALHLLGLRKALALRRRAMALLSRFLSVPAEPYGGRFRWTDAADGTSAVRVPRHWGGGLQAGDLVEVRSLGEIKATLDENGKCRGLKFLRPMAQYCGRRFRVLKPVRRILDEHEHVMRAVRETVVLEGGICHGQGIPGRDGCDRSCFFYWKEAWLTKIKEREHAS
jgi:hypothetical protein